MSELQRLQDPFKPDDIEWRVQRSMNTAKGDKAVVLAYVTNRAIMNRLDEVFGIGGWKNEYKEWRDKGILCGISAKVGDEWITKWDGAEESAIEAVKGGFSGSMKRAAVQWGIGRYLYNLDEQWVDVKKQGKNYINDKKSNVQGKWNPPALPDWALPEASRPKKLTLKQVFDRWLDSGGTAEQFDAYINEQFKTDRNSLTQSQLQGLNHKLDLKEGKAS